MHVRRDAADAPIKFSSGKYSLARKNPNSPVPEPPQSPAVLVKLRAC